jgi:uncharacterized membrane protein
MTRASRHLLRLFVTGLLAALPLAATIAIFAWAISLLLRWLGPNSAFGNLLGSVGLGVTGSEIVGYLIGVAIILGAILLLGALVEAGLQRGLAQLLDGLVRRIPLVRSVYDLVQRFVQLLSQRDEAGTRAMSPVWCRFGGSGAAVLALQSSPEVVLVEGERHVIVLVPTAPVPVGGGLIFVPEAWVTPAELSVEAITSLYVSMGVTAPQHLKTVPSLRAVAADRGSIGP